MMIRKFTLLLFALLLVQTGNFAQTASKLPRSTPEKEGVIPDSILHFLTAFGNSTNELHSFMLIRHGQVVAETWNTPYRPDLRHTMYSVSKSFAATAAGFAVSENKLTVDDKVISFFPDEVPPTISPFLAELKVKDLLTMSVGQEPEPTGAIITKETNWVRAFLATPIVHQPGSKFLYNSAATFMLSAIVQKVTGEKIIDYLTPRLFKPLGIENIDWETNPRDMNVGGWGLRLKTEDMAKFGQLFLQNGKWGDKQILPEAWVKEASTMKIIQHPEMAQEKKDASDWEQGYCYQMWRCRNNCYRGDGAFGQYIIVMPEQDAVIAITSETGNMQDELNLVWKHLLPAFQSGQLPANRKVAVALRQKYISAALPLLPKTAAPAVAKTLQGKTFYLSPNAQFIQQMSFDLRGDLCRLTLKADTATYQITFGSGKWAYGETRKLGPNLTLLAKNHFAGLPPAKTAGNFGWLNDSTLQLVLRYIESPHTETFTCVFRGDKIRLEVLNSFNKKNPAIASGMASAEKLAPARLIVRGDDMGFSHAANEALIESYRNGFETSIEVLVPSPWFPEAVKMLAKYPGVDVGIHLALTSEWDNLKWRPLSDCPSLKDANGYFFPMVFPNKNYPGQSILENKWTIQDIEKEFRAQIELGLKNIPNVSHVSAHMGCGYITDEVKALMIKLSQEYHIAFGNEKEYQLEYARFDGAHGTSAEKKQSFTAMLSKLEAGKTYVFVEHPAYDNNEVQAIHHIGYEKVAADRQGVTELFTDKDIKRFIEKNGIQLIGYKDLVPTSNK